MKVSFETFQVSINTMAKGKDTGNAEAYQIAGLKLKMCYKMCYNAESFI